MQELAQAFLKLSKTVCLAFPDHNGLPPEHAQLLGGLDVADTIPGQLWCPVVFVGLGEMAFATIVAVPKTAVNEDDGSELRQHDIGLSREVAILQPKPETHSVQHFTNTNLWLGVVGTYPPHNLGPAFLGVNVGHGAGCA